MPLAACGGGAGGSAPVGLLPSPVATLTPSPGGASAPAHVMVFAYIYGYAGPPTSVPLSDMTPHVNWAMTDEAHAAAVRSAGVKVAVYSNFLAQLLER